MVPAQGPQPAIAPGTAPAPVGRLGMFAWCTFDWANSAFPTVIVTFVFAAYFTTLVAADEITGTSQWAFTVSASMLAVALTGPILGAVADAIGRRKPWVLAATVVMVASTALLWFAEPKAPDVVWLLVCFALANFAFETGTIFYNAMLATIAPPGMIGRLSGWGWGLGYIGGLVCLLACLLLLVNPDPPLFGLDLERAEPVRATALLVAAWVALFALPFFLFTPDAAAGVPLGIGPAVRAGLTRLWTTIRNIRKYRQIALFLLAHMVYADGLNTLFAVGGIYAAVSFGMDFEEILLFGIAINITAGLGAFAFGWVDDWLGPKRTIVLALAALIGLGTVLVLIEDKTWFWVVALPLGLFLGPVQSASRSLMARVSPPAMLSEMFGLYALSGRATSFVGPALFGWVTALAGSQRIGLTTILVVLTLGLALLLFVREERAPSVVA